MFASLRHLQHGAAGTAPRVVHRRSALAPRLHLQRRRPSPKRAAIRAHGCGRAHMAHASTMARAVVCARGDRNDAIARGAAEAGGASACTVWLAPPVTRAACRAAGAACESLASIACKSGEALACAVHMAPAMARTGIRTASGHRYQLGARAVRADKAGVAHAATGSLTSAVARAEIGAASRVLVGANVARGAGEALAACARPVLQTFAMT